MENVLPQVISSAEQSHSIYIQRAAVRTLEYLTREENSPAIAAHRERIIQVLVALCLTNTDSGTTLFFFFFFFKFPSVLLHRALMALFNMSHNEATKQLIIEEGWYSNLVCLFGFFSKKIIRSSTSCKAFDTSSTLRYNALNSTLSIGTHQISWFFLSAFTF